MGVEAGTGGASEAGCVRGEKLLLEREALWVLERKWLRAKQLESGVCMGFGRAGGSGWDKRGTAPEGMNSVLEIHRPPRGKPSPFILTAAPLLLSVSASKGFFFFRKPLPCSLDVWPRLLSPWTSMLRTPASTVSPTLISPSSDGSLSHPPRPGHSPTLWSGPPNSPLPWFDLPGLSLVR